MIRRALWITTGLLAVLVSALGLPTERASAGPAAYDKATKSFRFRYTFANLPAGVQSVVGATDVQQTPEQETTVRGLVRLVSDVVYQITQGRARIGSLDYVDDIKDTDLVISLTGNPASPGWSTLKGSDGQPGQMVLYYQTLATTTQQDIVFTATHEMCHYLFGLADEYNYGNFPNGCPPRPGPGCLMDNYRPGMRGFMGKLCEDEHNSQNTQRKSCKALVDDYFAAHGITGGDKDPNVTPFVPDPRPTVIASAINQTRAVAAAKAQGRRSGSSLAAGLKSFAGKTLKTLIDEYNRNNGNKLIFTSQQLRVAIDLITKAGAVLPIDRPAGLSPENFASLKAEAQRLGGSPEIQGKKSDTSRFSAIRTGLRAFMRQLIKTDAGAAGVDTTEQNALIERLARDESRSPDQKKFDRLVSISDIQAELSLVTAENIIRVLDEMDAPGIPRQLEILGDFRKRFKDLSIPGRTSAGFGLRRTRFITPDPIDPQFSIVLTQGGVVSYKAIRDRGFLDFSRLIDRARIELVRPNFNAANPMPVDPRIDRPYEAIPVAELQAMKERNNSDIQSFLNDILNQLQRNRLENVGVLVPPGGLPAEVDSMLQVFQTKLREEFDVRLDVASVGTEKVADQLRHLSDLSHGSVLTVTDLDEVGAIAQRLKNEESSGSWVIIPQPSTLPQRDVSRPAADVVFPLYQKAIIRDPVQQDSLANLTEIDTLLQEFVKPKDPAAVTAAKDAADKAAADAKTAADDATVKDAAAKAAAVKVAAAKDAEKKAAEDDAKKAKDDADKAADAAKDAAAKANAAQKAAAKAAVVLTDPVRQKVDAARSAILLLNQSLDTLNEMALGKDAPPTDASLAKVALGQNSDDSRKKVTPAFLKSIYNAKVQIDALRNAMNEVKNAPPMNVGAGAPAGDSPLMEVVNRAQGQFGTDLAGLDTLIRRYERLLEVAVEKSKGEVQIYQRVDRVKLEEARKTVEMKYLGSNSRPNDARLRKDPGTSGIDRINSRIDLARFYAEKITSQQEDADLELVVGLSRPLPKVWDEQQQKSVALPRPTLELYSGLGLARKPLTADPGASSDTLLVYRIDSAFPLAEGWYDPMLNVDPRILKRLAGVHLTKATAAGVIPARKEGDPVTKEDEIDKPDVELNDPTDWDAINFNFSIGSNRRNVQLITGLVQDPNSRTRGTLSRADGYATVQVQVSAGSSVLGARVRGFYQLITKGPGPIIIQAVDFADSGLDGDSKADDGIYTTRIDIHEVTEETEYRVFVLADTTEGQARYIPLDNPNRDDQVPDPVDLAALPAGRRPKDKEAAAREAFDQRKLKAEQDSKVAEGPAIKFQRGTTIHFHVKP
jgi:hypothetical protein